MTDTVSVETENNTAVVETTPVVEEAKVADQQVETPAPIVEEHQEEKTVPLSALQKERKRRQELEEENRVYREHQLKQMQDKPEEPDDTQYDPVTKGELRLTQQQIIRAVEEKRWVKENPEKTELINEKLREFLKQRPNLTSAIEAASNRYEEAWELMDKLTPKQKASLKTTGSANARREAPGSPGAVPKAAGINQTVDFGDMSDSEFNAWRQAKKRSSR